MKFIKITSTLILSAAMLALSACNDSDEPNDTAVQTVTFSISENAFGSDSRAFDQDYTTGFTAGDECGLYIVRNGNMVYENVKLTATVDGDALVWQPETGITVAGGLPGEQYFLYYPYQVDMTGKVNATATTDTGFFAPLISGWTVRTDQSSYAGYTASDLMTAAGSATPGTGGKLQLTFGMIHRMALAVIELPRTCYKFTDTTIPNYTGQTTADFTSDDAVPYRMADGTYRYIANPANTTSTVSGIYNGGDRMFTINPATATAGSYKHFIIDGGNSQTVNETYAMAIGDYLCKNDAGNWYVVPQVSSPDGDCIGLVFQVGIHSTDVRADYNSALTDGGPKLPDGVFHGYAVALTDVGKYRWVYKPLDGDDYEYAGDFGTSKDTQDWKGYGNHRAIQQFAAANTDGWKSEHFEAAYHCALYGTESGEEWQRKYAAPANTSGWFLPSYRQLATLYLINRDNSNLLVSAIEKVKDQDTEHINWVVGDVEYWSSSEDRLSQKCACGILYNEPAIYSNYKYHDFNVRAVLAF